jgi:hypothetical protein
LQVLDYEQGGAVMQFSVSVVGIEDLLKQLNVPLAPVLKDITFAVGELVRSEIAVYPGGSHKPVIWASERQRRFYHAMRREAGLSPGYSRNNDPMSQRLANSWTLSHHGSTDALLDNKASYGPWVQNDIYQSAQHKATGWITDEKAIKKVERSGDVEHVAQKIIAKQTAFKD